MTTPFTPRDVMPQNDEPYDGFENYQTWCVNWWLQNDHEVASRCQKLVTEATSIVAEAVPLVDGLERATEAARELLAHLLSELVDEFNPVADQTTLFSDLMGTALREVDWRGIADRLLSQEQRTFS